MKSSKLQAWIWRSMEKGSAIALFLWLLAAILAGMGTFWNVKGQALQERGISTNATVVKIMGSYKTPGSDSGSRSWTLRLSFEVQDSGLQEHNTGVSGLNGSGFAVGDEVKVRYLPDNPSVVEIEPAPSANAGDVAFGTATVMAMIGLVLAARGLWASRSGSNSPSFQA